MQNDAHVPNFEQLKCFTNASPQRLVHDKMQYLETIADAAFEILKEKFQYAFYQVERKTSISIGGRTITNLRFADDIAGLAGSEEELAHLVTNQDQTASSYGMEISAEKIKLMTNSANPITTRTTVAGKELETV